MLDSEDQPPSEISVLLTDAEEMRRLNREFRSVDSATDVLSFPSGESSPFLGDIAICVPIAEQQASMHDTPLETELACLAIHGGLHLRGYDDVTDAGREEMISKMNAIARSIGLHPAEDWSSKHNG